MNAKLTKVLRRYAAFAVQRNIQAGTQDVVPNGLVPKGGMYYVNGTPVGPVINAPGSVRAEYRRMKRIVREAGCRR